ncbi:MAG: SUMF1/EgtB/PvdO family nonheme iron enzyme, partial [Gammaproteobacteria bacterium]|nr:SUMF1/EgtB/PvdO family nonheme iron enzyme [Gammaproteobacteria bacterium]
EAPRHTVRLAAVQLQNQLVSNREFMAFIEDGGYQAPGLWLADGWTTVQAQAWRAPLYWVQRDGAWHEYTLGGGLQALEPDAPVRHVSAYEADAYAQWCQRRLPTEFEWEVGATRAGANSQADAHNAVGGDWFGRCWQWTGSAYRPYPGFRVADGAVGEYNGKFMGNQWVLRGSSSVTPAQHARTTYRNFFYLQDRWQYSGIRLARDV